MQSSKCAAGATAALPINASLYDKLNFDFVRDFAPVAGIMRVPNVMEVHPSVPAKTVIISDKSCDYHGAANSLRPRAVRGRPPGGVQHKTAFGAPPLPGARRATAAQAGSLLTEPKNEAAQFHHAVRRRDPRLTRLIALSLRGGRALV